MNNCCCFGALGSLALGAAVAVLRGLGIVNQLDRVNVGINQAVIDVLERMLDVVLDVGAAR